MTEKEKQEEEACPHGRDPETKTEVVGLHLCGFKGRRALRECLCGSSSSEKEVRDVDVHSS